MKILNTVIVTAIVALWISCTSAVKFPISSTVPSAEIKVKKKQDENNNYMIELTAENLADPSRLDPPGSVYSVWVVSEDGETNNIGQLINKNSEKAVLETLTPYNAKEIFITAESSGELNYPSGTEISRVKFDKQ